MTRWAVAVLVAGLVILAGYLLLLNPAPVSVRLTPTRSVTPPLAGALLVAFAAGGVLVGLAAGLRAGSRGWRDWRAQRRTRREARRTQVVDRARDLVWAGAYPQARAELLRGEGAVPADATRLLLVAETHIREGDAEAARKLLEEGLVQIGMEPRLLDLLAEAAERSGDLRGAADALERARRLQPESPRLARRLRDVYAAIGRWTDAVALQRDLLLHVHEPGLLAAEQQALRGLRYQAALDEPDARRAVTQLKALVREDPTFVPGWVSIGDLLARDGRRFAARRVWERGARHTPAVVVLERLERLNASEGKPERTTRLYRRLLRRHGEGRGLSLLLARHLLNEGEFEAAEQALGALPAPLAGHPLAHTLWGELHRRRGTHRLAADTFVRAWGSDLGLVAPFRCGACRRPADTWTGHCPECRRWGTYRATMEAAAEGG